MSLWKSHTEKPEVAEPLIICAQVINQKMISPGIYSIDKDGVLMDETTKVKKPHIKYYHWIYERDLIDLIDKPEPFLSELTLKNNSLIMIKGSKPHEQQSLAAGLVHMAQKQNIKDSMFVFMNDEAEIKTLDPECMRRYGWVRCH